jgi:hypothetical protein
MTLWPSIADERELAMRQRFASVRAIAGATKTPWQRSSTPIALLFFGLTLFAIAATFGLFALLELPKGLLTAILAIGIAELLIQQRKMFGTGIESALWIGGLFAFLFGLPSEGSVEALLAFAAAAAIAGLRMRNACFGLLGALLVILYLGVAAHGTTFWSGGAALLALVFALGGALGSLRIWSRPSSDALAALLAVTMPVVAYVTGRILASRDAFDPRVAAVFGALAVLLLTIGLRRRDHVLLVAGLITVACVAIEARELFLHSDEARLLTAGLLLLTITALVARALRGRTRGIVAAPTAITPLEEAIQLGGAIALTHPQTPPDSGPELKPGGGAFGGAGASGDF